MSESQFGRLLKKLDEIEEKLNDRLSKISGALRYKDKGMSIQISGIFNSQGRFDIDLGQTYQLFEKADYTVSLISFSTTSDITNITSSNNMFYFSSPTSGIVSVTLPVGVYSMTALNSTIQQLMQNAGYYNTAAGAANGVSEVGSLLYNVNISTNTAANRTVLQIRFGSGYTVYFNQPNTFWNLLGFYSTDVITDPFPNATSPVNGYYYSATFSENQINILNNILQVNIGCTLAEGSIYVTNNNSLNSINSIYLNQIIAYKPYIDPPGSILAIIPATPIKIKITEASKNLRNFTVFCVDNNLKPQNFNSNQFAMNLLIEQV